MLPRLLAALGCHRSCVLPLHTHLIIWGTVTLEFSSKAFIISPLQRMLSTHCRDTGGRWRSSGLGFPRGSPIPALCGSPHPRGARKAPRVQTQAQGSGRPMGTQQTPCYLRAQTDATAQQGPRGSSSCSELHTPPCWVLPG